MDYSEKDFRQINNQINYIFSLIGRIVVDAEVMKYALIECLIWAEFESSRHGNGANLRVRIYADYANVELGKVIKKSRKIAPLHYPSDIESKRALEKIAKDCQRLAIDRNAIAHSWWSIGWSIGQLDATGESYKFNKKTKKMEDTRLVKQMEHMLDEFSKAIGAIHSAKMDIFGRRPIQKNGVYMDWRTGVALSL